MANTYTLISSVTVGAGGASSIDFTSIPATYTDLLLDFSLRSSTTQNWTNIKFNNSATSFSGRTLQGSGSSAASGTGTDNDYMVLQNQSSYTANSFSSSQIYIPNYAGSSNKSFSIETCQETNATTAYMNMSAMLWSNTAAINQITLTADTGTFVQYSTAYLYGIKNS